MARWALGLMAVTSCSQEFDTRRTAAPRGTLGEETFHIVCERIHDGETPRDVTFELGRRACTVGLNAGERAVGAGPKVNALGHMRADLVAGIDAAMPRALEDPLDRFLLRILPLYGPDGRASRMGAMGPWRLEVDGGAVLSEDLLPRTTRALANDFNGLLTSETLRNDFFRALGRASQRQGYRPARASIGLLRPVLAYDHVDDTLDAILRMTRATTLTQPEGPARAQMVSLMNVLQAEFAHAGPSTDTRGGTTLDATLDLLFRSDATLAAGHRIDVVRRDVRGVAAVAIDGTTVPAPFADADRDGLADLRDGQYARGAEVIPDVPTPFPARYGAVGTRDAVGRATTASGAPLYRYADLDRTVLATLARQVPPLLGAPQHQNVTALRLMRGAQPLLGARRAAMRAYPMTPTAPAQQVSYRQFDASRSPIVDLVHGAGTLFTHRDAGAYLALTRALMAPDREALTARLVGAMLSINAISNRYPNATMSDQSVIWDDVMDVVRRIAAEPGLLEDILQATASLQQPLPSTGLWDASCAGSIPAQNLSRGFGAYAKYRDRVQPMWCSDDSAACRAQWNRHLDNSLRLSQVADRARPDTVDLTTPGSATDNRSVLERLFHLIDDLNGAHICNKTDARVRVYTSLFGLSLPPISVPGASNIPSCQLVEVPDAAVIYLRAIAGNGRAVLPLQIPGIVGTLANLARTFRIPIDGTLDSLVESQSGIVGFNSQPSPYAIARLVFNPNPNDFLNDLVSPATIRNAPATSPPPQTWVRNAHPGTIFAWEGYCFYDSIRPIAVAFSKHDRRGDVLDPALSPGADPATMDPRGIDSRNGSKLFVELISAFHRHWATQQAGGFQTTTRCETCPEGRNYSQMDGAVRYEPILSEALDGDILPALSALTTELRRVDVGGGRNGLQATASLVRALVDPRARAMDGMPAFTTPVTYRDGNTQSLWADRTTPVGGAPLFYLFADAFNAMDPLLAADVPRRTDWQAARSSTVDQFLTVDGTGSSSRFHNRTLAPLGVLLASWLQDRLAAHAAAGDLDAWGRGLSGRLATTVSDAPFAVVNDLTMALYDDPGARTVTAQLLTHLLDETNDSPRTASPFATTMTSAADILQTMRADREVDPILHGVAPWMSPDTGSVQQALVFLDRSRELDTEHVLRAMLSNMVQRPTNDDPLAQEPLVTLGDGIADTQRQTPGDHGPMSAQDAFQTFSAVVDFLRDERRGLEQFYYLVQHRRLPQ